MPASFRALLIGVPYYVDDSIEDLSFIETDLAELSAALTGATYDVAVHDVRRTDKDSIDTEIELFLSDAEANDTVLIFLSGHGIHYNGMDYLVPSGARVRSRDFPSRCVPIDFEKYIEPSKVGDTVILIDACREGIKRGGWPTFMRARRASEPGTHPTARRPLASSPGRSARSPEMVTAPLTWRASN
jgi:hypothetical protein